MDFLETLGFSVLMFVKGGLLIFLFLYLIFAAVVIRQVRAMTQAVSTGFETPIKFVVVIHFIISVIVFVTAIVIL